MRAFKYLALLFSSVALISCLEDPKAPTSEGGASFELASFSSSAEASGSTEDGLVNAVRYKFDACFKDVKFRDIIEHHAFDIHLPGGEVRSVTTNQKGCVDWTHEIEFHFFGKPEFIEQRYVVTPKGIHQGELVLRAGLNPRAIAFGLKNVREFVNLDEDRSLKPLSQTQALTSLKDDSFDNFKVEMPSVSLKFKTRAPVQAGFTPLEMELKGRPQFILQNQLGDPFLFNIERADVKVLAELFVKFPDGSMQKFATADSGQAKIVRYRNEVLTVPFEFQVHRFPTRGELYLGLELDLKNVQLQPQSGKSKKLAFRIGEVNDFGHRASAERRNDIDLDSGLKTLSQSLDSSGRWRNTASYFFDPMRLKYGGIVLQDESSSKRTVKLLVTACMKDPIFIKKPILFRSFKVESQLIDTRSIAQPLNNDLSQQKTIEESTDHTGCMRWSDSLTHKYYESERYFIKQYTVSDFETHSEKTLQAIVNPWNTGWLFAQDMVERSQSDIENQPLNGPRARVFLDGYRMNARGTDYRIDDHLNLHVQRKYNLVLYPKVLRHDSQAYGSMGNEKLRDGLYLLTVALVRNFNHDEPDPRLFVNSWKRVVHVKGGVIATPITFSIEDLTMIGSRNKLIVEIQNIDDSKVQFLPGQDHLPLPEKEVDQEATLAQKHLVDKRSGLVTNSYVGPFIPLYENSGSSLIESPEVKMDQVLSEGHAHKAKLEEQWAFEHRFHAFDRKYRLKPIHWDSPQDLQWLSMSGTAASREWNDDILETLLKQGRRQPSAEKQFSSHLCRLWTDRLLPEMLERFSREDTEQDFDRPGLDPEMFEIYSEVFVRWCDSQLAKGEQVFSFDKKLVIKKIDNNRIRYNGGSSFNLNVGANFRLDKGQGWMVRKNHGSDISFSASAGLDTPFGGAGIKRGESYSSSESASFRMGRGSALSYGSGAYLVVQHSIFRIGIDDYDQCLIVKPRYDIMNRLMNLHLSEFFPKETKRGYWHWLPFLASDEDEEEANERMVRNLVPEGRHLDLIETGLRICQNLENPKPMEINENFYYITQHFTSGDMHDPTDLRNRLWLLEIRSARDFKVFLESVLTHNQLSDVGNITNTPIHILSNSYSRFKEHLPAWPSLYTYYNYDPHMTEHCDPRQDMAENLLESFKQISLGPFADKDGLGMDFWDIFYCPQDRQKF